MNIFSRKYDFVRDACIGVSDGLVISSVLCSAIVGFNAEENAITFFKIVICILLIISLTMSLATYFSGKRELYYVYNNHRKNKESVDKMIGDEINETELVFSNIGIDEDVQKMAKTEIINDNIRWQKFVNDYELDGASIQKLKSTAIIIGVSYFIGGLLVTILHYFVFTNNFAIFYVRECILIMIAIFGFLKCKLMYENVLWGVIRILIIAIVASAAAYFIGKLFM